MRVLVTGVARIAASLGSEYVSKVGPSSMPSRVSLSKASAASSYLPVLSPGSQAGPDPSDPDS